MRRFSKFNLAASLGLLLFLGCLVAIDYYFEPKTAAEPTKTMHFFIETKTGKHYLTSRESCAIESAANKHNNSIVIVYNVNGDFNATNKYVKLLSTLSNIDLKFLNATEAFSGTPLDVWHRTNAIGTSRHPTEHLSDALRLAVLYKNGGIYSDTDIITIKNLDQFRNTVVDQGGNLLTNCMMIFDRGSKLLFEWMTAFAGGFRGHLWGHQGPEMLDALVKKRCNITKLSKIYNKPEMCDGITVKPPITFVLLYFLQFYLYFSKDSQIDLTETYTVHLYAKWSRNTNAKPGDGSFIDLLFQEHCPRVYQLIMRDGVI